MVRTAYTLAALAWVMWLGAGAISVAADSSTRGLRADGQAVWVTPRPAAETLPSGAHMLHISVRNELERNQLVQRPLTVTSSKRIEKIVALLNALPAAQPGVRSCPADFGIRVRLTLYRKRGVAPLAIAEVDPQGCGGVKLTIDGRSQPGLEGGRSLIDRLDHVLGVTLDTHPPGLQR